MTDVNYKDVYTTRKITDGNVITNKGSYKINNGIVKIKKGKEHLAMHAIENYNVEQIEIFETEEYNEKYKIYKSTRRFKLEYNYL